VNYPRVLITTGGNSIVSVIENYVGGSGDQTFTNSVSEIYVGEDATVNHYRLMNETDDTYDVGYGRVRIDTNGAFNSRSFFRGCGIGRYDLNVSIEGENASCDLQGLYFTNGAQHMDNFINIDHVRPNCQSNLFYKGILAGRSRAVFGGTVLVRKEAQKTNSVQSDKNLILSPHAEIDSKPALFIYADDVKCAHGATAGNIDADTVFYMRSRGIDLEAASRLIIYGFAGEIIDKVEIPELRSYLAESFLSSLPSHRFEF
jgi:Fe-S cluster assembly protein SufD